MAKKFVKKVPKGGDAAAMQRMAFVEENQSFALSSMHVQFRALVQGD